MGREWNFDTLRDLAMKLTLDERGNDATSPDFAPDHVVQFGFDLQYGTEPRAMGTLFGAAKPIDSERNAYLPPNWLSAWNYFYDAMWKEHWMPNDAYRNSDLFGQGSVFNSGNLAMAYTHTWYTCCIDPANKAGKVRNWDIAVVRQTQHPNEAFQVYK